MKMIRPLLTLAFAATCASARPHTHRPTFMQSYRDQRCFKEMFYYGSTFELFVELVEPKAIKDEWIKDPTRDGLLWNVYKLGVDTPMYRGILGNKDSNSYSSFNFQIDKPEMEAVYFVCVGPSDGIFHNAAQQMEAEGSTSLFGSIFQQQDFSKIQLEVSLTLERIFHGTFKTKDEILAAQESPSKRSQMAAVNVITNESMDQVDMMISKIQESSNAIQNSQQVELASCFEFIESLSNFED